MINSFDKKLKIIFIIIIAMLFIFSSVSFLIYEDGYRNMNMSKEYFNFCKKYLNSSREEKEKLELTYGEIYGLTNEDCIDITKYDVPSNSAFYIYLHIIENGISSIVIPFFIPAIIIFPYVYIITKKFRSGEIKNYLLRDNYKNYIKRIFKISYSNIMILPLILIVIFLFCCFLTKNINPLADIHSMTLDPNIAIFNNYKNPIYYIIYILIVILNVGMYNNVALIITSKNKNFLSSYIESFLIIYIIWCISEIIIGNAFQKFFNIGAGNFSLLNIYKWSSVNNITAYLIINLTWYILTLIISIHCYKNKEKIVEMCEG